jgi:hypothetical protein
MNSYRGNTILESYEIKTQRIKQIKPIKAFLEKGLTKRVKSFDFFGSVFRGIIKEKDQEYRGNNFGEKYYDLISRIYNAQLREFLTIEEIDQLLHVDFIVPPNSTIIFIPGQPKPILGFNIKNCPPFTTPGWVTHFTTRKNLARIAKTGRIDAPLETIYSKKKFFSTKNFVPKRLTDGISLTFENYKEYQSYMKDNKPKGQNYQKDNGKRGGMILLPMINALSANLVLDFDGTMDQWPEIVLRSPSYSEYNPQIVIDLLSVQKRIPIWLSMHKETKRFFKLFKKEIPFLSSLLNFASDSAFHSEKIDDEIYWFDRDAQIWNYEKLKESFSKSNPNLSYHSISKMARIEHYKKIALFYGKGPIFERLKQIYLSKDVISKLIQFLKEDNYFLFSLLINYKELQISFTSSVFFPILATFARNNEPIDFKGTIFEWRGSYLRTDQLFGKDFIGICIVLTLMKTKKIPLSQDSISIQYYLDILNHMTPEELKRLMNEVIRQSRKTMEAIIQRKYRQNGPCSIDLKKGVVLVNKAFEEDGTLQRITGLGITIFSEFFSDRSGNFIDSELDSFFRSVLQPKSLDLGKSLYKQRAFFFLRNGHMIAYSRNNRTEMRIV